ncbi:MAG: stage V sporulation protein AD [Firmicutes bacterium]|nr:stage V sporulation protein AD [Bacillota bacterium]
MVKGNQSFIFNAGIFILSTSTVVGPFEGKGPLSGDFDIIHDDIWMNQDSFEKAEKIMLEEAALRTIEKAGIKKEEINLFISGDLLSQIISSNFAARTIGSPYIGIYSACSGSMESLLLAALIMEGNDIPYILTGTSSHNASAEKQFRYPTEYGSQKPPTAQWTVTGAGTCLLTKMFQGPKITSATIGKIVDMGVCDPFNMGSAMAPAAADTLYTHFQDLGITPDYYDIIATGDLGNVGHKICKDLLKDKGLEMPDNIFTDCGMLIYGDNQNVQAGGSGCACSAVVTFGHFLNRMNRKEIKRILVVATGALHSPLSYQQKESIPGIAHGVAIEM